MNDYGVELSATVTGHNTDDPDWPHYAWEVTLVRNVTVRNVTVSNKMVLPFKMGMAHVQTRCGKPIPSRVWGNTVPHPCEHIRCRDLAGRLIEIPTPPTLYGVLCALKADATNGLTFSEWCAEYGYDTDSRKAFDLYYTCQESETQSRKFFGDDWPVLIDDEDYV